MNQSAFSVSIMFIGLILIILLFSILYFFWGNVKAVQDSLSTTGSIFSAIATLGAAAIAAYLFNDWKDQQEHQNSIQFGIEVYASFKKFDECFTEICNELIYLEYQLKEVLKNNEKNLRFAFLNNSSKVSKRSQELFNHYLNFQDSYTNYCIVTNQEDLLIDIEQTRDSLLKFCSVLTDIEFENFLEAKLQKVLFLNSDPVNEIGTYIYNYYIKQILEKVRL
ncbi:hypothetical protein VXQ35_01995 [Acinetobacter oleivorans]|uniref:hypothetical protein n=1 Tax=Acinetobacter oleivorans TaxID=1148157 RepID=UPI003A8B8058